MSRNLVLRWKEAPPKGNMFPYGVKCDFGYLFERDIREFCAQTFGNGEFGSANRRWFVSNLCDVYFLNEADMVLFVTAFSGEMVPPPRKWL